MKTQNDHHTPTTPCIAQTALKLKDHRVQIACHAPHLSSDGGALLLRQQDEKLGITTIFATLLSDDREPTRMRHSR